MQVFRVKDGTIYSSGGDDKFIREKKCNNQIQLTGGQSIAGLLIKSDKKVNYVLPIR